MTTTIPERLEELRARLDAEDISYGELAELQGLTEHIQPGDVQLLEAAGVPEFDEDDITITRNAAGGCVVYRNGDAVRWFEYEDEAITFAKNLTR